MKLPLVARALPSRHGLDALALTRRDQAAKVHGGPATLSLVAKFREEWLYPLLELLLPLCVGLVHRAPHGPQVAWDGKVCGGVVLVVRIPRQIEDPRAQRIDLRVARVEEVRLDP